MLGVIVCDDDRFMLEVSAKLARKCIEDCGLAVAVICVAADSGDMLRYIEKNPGAYLYFLDIDFGKANLNGVDIAKVIKKLEPRSKIVFVTSHADMGMSVLKSGVEAFGFIEKTTDENKMILGYRKYISLAMRSIAPSADAGAAPERQIELLVGVDEYVSLPVSRILYVEADKAVSHTICYHTLDGSSVSARDTIENALKILGNDFMKSHRSVIINKNQVVSISDGMIKFAGGEKAACSFRLRNEIMKNCGIKKI